MKTHILKLLVLILLALIPVVEIFAQPRMVHPTHDKKEGANAKFIAGNTRVPGANRQIDIDDPLYRNAIGLRAGGTSGLTVKHFFTSGNAIEGILGVWPNALGITGLYENYSQIGDIEGFNFYFGGGGHMNYSTGKLYAVYREGDRYYTYRKNYPGFALGIDLVGGLEYKIPQIPFALSLDLKPFIEVNNAGAIFTALDPGIGIKITF